MEGYYNNVNNVSITENGAFGYKSTGSQLLDLNFKLSSLRARDDNYIMNEFLKAYHENPKYAVKWLFFVRDILEGMGERRTFRVGLKYLAISQPAVARAILPLIPKYGRYDDPLVLLDTPLARETAAMYKRQLEADLAAMAGGEEISLLAKWLPSINTSSTLTKKYARQLCSRFGMTPGEYRKTLSALRAYSKVTETAMSASRWSEIDYKAVPAKANMRYQKAFERHDLQRRYEYLEQVVAGKLQVNAKGIMPYEIVHRLVGPAYFGGPLQDDLLSEILWKQIVTEGFQNDWGIEDAIVVADGSGSMLSPVSGSTSVRAMEVGNSLAIYFAEQLKGAFHNKAITFSGNPQFISFRDGTGLKDKLEIIYTYQEVANTNIEKVFDLILAMAQDEKVPREELPKQVLIISDMEFDQATRPLYRSSISVPPVDAALFERIEEKFERSGYKMPRLIFWNVCGRTDTIPKVDKGEGLCLLSGFSQNAMKIAKDPAEKDPYRALLKLLDSPRYQVVEDAIKGSVA